MNQRPKIIVGFCIAILGIGVASQASWSGPLFIRPPLFTLGAHANAPLAGSLSFTTSKPTQVTATIKTATRTWQIPPADYQRSHHLPIIGFQPEESGDLTTEITVQDRHGNRETHQKTFSFTAPALPENFPPIKTTISNPEAMEPGLTLFNVFQWQDKQLQEDIGWIVAVDNQGHIQWYYQGDGNITDIDQLQSGNIIFINGHHAIKEINLFGEEVGHWFASNHLNDHKIPNNAISVPIDTFHHEVNELPNGHIVTLSTEVRSFPDYPQQPTNSEPTGNQLVVGDQIVEFTRQGEVIQSINLLDLLDPYRLSYSSLAPIWDNWAYPDLKDQGGTADWAHANAIDYDPKDDSYIVSLRHQDAVVKISRHDQSLRWILGNHNNWNEPFQSKLLTPSNDTENLAWPFHQHAPELTPQGTILLFDNGNFKVSPPHPPTPATNNYSRAVEYKINEADGTIDQVWSYGGPATPDDQFYSSFVGDADVLPHTGNILISDGGRLLDSNGQPSDNVQESDQWARLVEVTHDRPARKVFELTIHDNNRNVGWTIYRADRIPGL